MKRNLVLGLLCLTSVSGCSTITSLGNTFEGAADYRLVPMKMVPQLLWQTGSRNNQQVVEAAEIKNPLVAGPVPLSNFSRFQRHPGSVSASSQEYFTKGDHIQVLLRTGVIGWFSEGVEQRAINDLLGSALKGEIAIIANVTEGSRNPVGTDDKGNLQGRVIFYSNDVYLGQRLNEYNVPIYGPAKYDGGPLTIDLWVLELDRAESQQMEAVLKTLASLAKESPAMAMPGVDLLSRIGTAFLNSNQDDIIGHFTVSMTTPRQAQQTSDPILQVSDIIVNRTRDRVENAGSLDECWYDPGSGRVTNAAKGSCGAAAGDNLFVLSVRKVPEGPDITPRLTLAELNDRISKTTVGSAVTPDLSSAIQQVADGAISSAAYSDSVVALDRVKGGSLGGPREIDAELILKNFQCALMAHRDRSSALLKDNCGGDRAAERQMDIGSLSRFSTLLVDGTCLQPEDLSVAQFIPDGVTTLAGLQAARQALIGRVAIPPVGQDGTIDKSQCS